MMNTWQHQCRARALKMADEIIENFNEKLQASSLLLPDPVIDSEKHEVLNTFMDGLLGAICLCVTKATQDASARMESAVVENIRAKFSEIRKQNIGLSRHEESIPIPEE